VPDEKKPEKKRRPKGGVKHTPGRSHARKSGPPQKDRFQTRAAKKHQAAQASLRTQWAEWDAMSAELRKFFPEKKPKRPRPDQ
jgi:hypothetical protein